MFTRVPRADLRGGSAPVGTVLFQGRDHGSQVSFFVVDDEPGRGPRLHRHPYSETWIVQDGEALFVADGETIRPDIGDVVVVGAGTPHKFVNVGTGRLRMVCIHASPELVQEDLESDAEREAFSRAVRSGGSVAQAAAGP